MTTPGLLYRSRIVSDIVGCASLNPRSLRPLSVLGARLVDYCTQQRMRTHWQRKICVNIVFDVF